MPYTHCYRPRLSGLGRIGLGLSTVFVFAGCSGNLGKNDEATSPAGASVPGPTATPPAVGASNSDPVVSDPGQMAAASGEVVRFTEVFTQVFGGCAGFCHGGGALGNLNMIDEFDAYAALVNTAAQGADIVAGSAAACATTGVIRVVPGDAAASLLYQKLAGTQACGTAMPPPETGAAAVPANQLDLVKRWIDGGALPGFPPTDGEVGSIPGAGSGPMVPAVAPPPVPTVAEWPSFGPLSDNSRNNRAETILSPANVGQLTRLWAMDLSGGMNGIPALVDGVLYFADYSSLYAASPATGEPMWRARVGSVQSTPLITEDRVYVSGGRGLFAFDRSNGQPVWMTTMNTHANTTMISAPILAGDLLVLGVAGNELAQTKSDYTFVGYVKGVNKDTGVVVWEIPVSGSEVNAGNGVSVWSSAAVDTERKLAFIGTGNAYEMPAGTLSDALLAINYESGTIQWSNQYSMDDVYVSVQCPSRNCEEDFDIGTSPNLFVANGIDAVGVGSKGGIFKAINRDTGEDIWSRDLSGETGRGAAGGIMTTAAIGDRMIYTNSNAWTAHGFRRTGQHDPSDTSITYALDIDTGATVWQQPMPAPAIGMALLANGVVYQALINGALYAFDAAEGTILWDGENIGHDLAPGFSLADGVLYGGSGGTWWVGSTRPGANIVAYSVE
jgi:polyvinyl alcohol dehydrogenase (cytochrome)